MPRFSRLALTAFAVVLATLAASGGSPSWAGSSDQTKCTKSTQACLDEMVAGIRKHGWLGIEYDKDYDTGALKVKRVVAGSPAEEAGFKAGDELIALNGIKYGDESNKAALAAIKKEMAPGRRATFTVSRGGAEKKLIATLGHVPADVMAQWVGNHMLDHATGDVAQK